MKCLRVLRRRKRLLSLPVRGAWIEILSLQNVPAKRIRRSPCGERGLKWSITSTSRPVMMSLPVRGAWIEILAGSPFASMIMSLPVRGAWIEIPALSRSLYRALASLPVRGAWIEISTRPLSSSGFISRSPCGERGLKLRIVALFDCFFSRSPCGERGLKYQMLPYPLALFLSSLPVRGAWIEIPSTKSQYGLSVVAPRAGSVD